MLAMMHVNKCVCVCNAVLYSMCIPSNHFLVNISFVKTNIHMCPWCRFELNMYVLYVYI